MLAALQQWWIAWWTRPTKTERLFALMQDQHRANIELMATMVESVTKQNGVFEQYLKMITAHPEPEVRTMTDAQEAEFERIREARLNKEGITSQTPVQFDFGGPLPDINALAQELRDEALAS